MGPCSPLCQWRPTLEFASLHFLTAGKSVQGKSCSGILSLPGVIGTIPYLAQSLPSMPLAHLLVLTFPRPHRERSGFFSPDQCEPESPWASSSAASTPTTPTTEGESDGLSYNQRSLQRWEKDEELGELSTISPVLYANMNFPSLKQDYPGW